jgi:hypothetical protein
LEKKLKVGVFVVRRTLGGVETVRDKKDFEWYHQQPSAAAAELLRQRDAAKRVSDKTSAKAAATSSDSFLFFKIFERQHNLIQREVWSVELQRSLPCAELCRFFQKPPPSNL